MTKSFTLNNTSDSILSRICLVSLIWLLLVLGGFSTSAYGRTSSVNTAALWKSSTYSTGDSVVWSAPNVTFKLHNGGNIELYLNDHILIQKNQHYTLEWRVAEGYTINVTQVSVRARSTEEAYITVEEGDKSDNIFASYTTVYSQSLSLGNTGNVDIYPEGDNEAIIHMDEINVTYTIVGEAQEVTFDEDQWRGSNNSTTNAPFVKNETHVTFQLLDYMKKYDYEGWGQVKHYFFLSGDNTAKLKWTVDPGYYIQVSQINLYATNDKPVFGSRGKGFIQSSATGSEKIKLYENSSWVEQSCSKDDNRKDIANDKVRKNLFGSTPAPLGENDYFTFSAIDAEWQIEWITLTYTINPNSYDITLNNETPTEAGSSSVTVTYDANSQLSITNPTKDGYTFDGWYSGETAGNGSGTKVIDVDGNLQENITVDATVYTGADGIWKKTTATTLYAKWILNGIKNIMLDNQGATTAGTDSLSVRFMTDHYSKASISAPAKTGYTFDGYYSASSDGVQVIDADGNVVADVEGYTDSDKKWINGDDETTLYAHWTGVSYSVRFNGNGSTDGSMSNQAFVYGTAQSLTTIGFEKTCTVTYNANGGSCGIASSETPFSFLGWATSAGGDVEYTDGEEVENLTSTSGAVFDLYAKWAAEANSVTLPTPTKEDSIFGGWYNAEDVRVGAAGDSYTPSGNETLKARWKAGVNLTISNLKDGDLVDTTEHAIFILHSDGYAITDYKDGYGFYVWKPLSHGTTKDVTLSWKKTIADGDYSISVTNITFKAKAYNSNGPIVYKGQISFNGGEAFSIGTNSLFTDGGWSSTIGGEGEYESGVVIQLINTSGISWETFDYHFKDFQVEYTITPNAPTPHNANLTATLSESAKQTLDVRVGSGALFTMSNPADDFEYTYRLKEDYANAHLEDGLFWATAAGDYEIQARVASADDHEASAWSTCTVHVTRTCVFNNTTGDKEWGTTDNWAYSITPNSADAVRVLGNLTIDEQIEMLSLSIEGAAVVEIAPTGGLTVGAGGIIGASKNSLILKADSARASLSKGKTGYLRISPEYTDEMPEATIELFCKAVHKNAPGAGATSSFQCVGAPIADLDVPAKTVFPAGTWLYTWDEDGGESGTWVNTRSSMNFTPFQGFDISQKKSANGYLFKFEGHLVSGAGAAKVIALDSTYRGNNLLANSFTAPIDITSFDSEDFDNAHQTIYILNSGAKGQGVEAKGIDSPGKWFGVPISLAAEMAKDGYPCIIPSMQGFWVQAKTGGGSIKLDYSKLVWGKTYVDSLANKPLRAPRRGGYASESMPITGRLKIDIYGGEESDCLYMLESERYDRAYEDGYDANKMEGDGVEIFTIEGESEFSVNATNSIIGTRVGVRTGEETAYTLEFSRFSAENELALRDNETNEEIDIYEGMQYTFFAEPNATLTERFEIVEREAPSITTGVDNADTKVKVHKFIKDNQVFILKNGVLYNTMGATVR